MSRDMAEEQEEKFVTEPDLNFAIIQQKDTAGDHRSPAFKSMVE